MRRQQFADLQKKNAKTERMRLATENGCAVKYGQNRSSDQQHPSGSPPDPVDPAAVNNVFTAPSGTVRILHKLRDRTPDKERFRIRPCCRRSIRRRNNRRPDPRRGSSYSEYILRLVVRARSFPRH